MQPSTVGQIFNCLYTVVVNRIIKGFGNYPTGVSVLMTINPSQSQVSGFSPVYKSPHDWNPRVADLRKKRAVNYVAPPAANPAGGP